MSEYEITDRNRVRRVPTRGQYDKETVYEIVDNALYCHVSFLQDGRPFIIPTLHARRGDEILLHGATASRLIRHVQGGHEICLAMTHIDGIVLARSAFHHSINYRSAVLFGRGQLVEGERENMEALEVFTERLMPGRWQDTRVPNRKELKATAVVAISIDLASAKIRSGPPVDDDDDHALPHWAGVLPLSLQAGPPQPDAYVNDTTPVPSYVEEYIRTLNQQPLQVNN
jgi:nitroimidazol reductase NimA-like FMN-containing flavoprotein (pyridoxamine 5'-phosphate oxidase superfamily)